MSEPVYAVDDREPDNRQEYETAVVVVLRARGVNENDAYERAQILISNTISKLSTPGDAGMDVEILETTRGDHRFVGKILDVTTVNNALYQGYLKVRTTGRATRIATYDRADDE